MSLFFWILDKVSVFQIFASDDVCDCPYKVLLGCHSFSCKSRLALAKPLLEFFSSMHSAGIDAVFVTVRAAILSNPSFSFDLSCAMTLLLLLTHSPGIDWDCEKSQSLLLLFLSYDFYSLEMGGSNASSLLDM